MIIIDKTFVVGWEAAIRGLRNSFDSWDKSDSNFNNIYENDTDTTTDESIKKLYEKILDKNGLLYKKIPKYGYISGNTNIGANDLNLMKKLISSGDSHAKFMRYITVTMDVTAPRYWWAEYDTYKVGTVRNSCSTMHTITRHEFTRDNFACDEMTNEALEALDLLIVTLNKLRKDYLSYTKITPNNYLNNDANNSCTTKDCSQQIENNDNNNDNYNTVVALKKQIWYSIIQLLPASFMQKATLLLNYQVLRHIYNDRKNHKLNEWQEFCEWIKLLPYSSELLIN